MGLRLRFVGALFKRIVSGLPSCIKDATVAWWKDFNNVQGGIITTPITGVLAFDGINDYVGFSTNSISADGDFTVSFYMQLNSLPSSNVTVIVLTDGSINDSLYAFMDSSGFLNVARSTGTASGAKKYDISGLVGTSFFVEIVKTTGSITSITINGINNTVASANFIAYGTVNCIGGYPGSLYSGQYYIWDININDQHAYTGYPDGNTNAAWVDTIGAVDGSVVGTPTTANASYSSDTSFVEEEIGTRIDTIYYGQYLDATSGQIDFHRGTGTFDYTDPSDGSRVTGTSIPVDGLFTVPANGICDIGVNPSGAFTGKNYSVYESFYPVCERAGTVLHDVLENTFHISVATPSWSESLYGSDFLNQCGFLDKTTSDSLGYTWESEVNGVPTALDDDCLIPIALWHYETLYDVDGEIIYDVDGEIIQVRAND